MRYRLLRHIHLWLSIAVTVPVVVLSLSGALLVYGPELQRLVDPEPWAVTAEGPMMPPGALVESARAQRPDLRIWALSNARDPDEAWTAWLAGGAGVINVDPYTGRILAHYKPQETFQGWITALHRRLLAEGETARWIRNGISAVALSVILQLVLGFWLWLMPRRRWRRLAVTTRHGAPFAVMRIHQLTGILTALLILAVAFTGMAMYWHGPTQKVVEWVTGDTVRQPEPPDFEGLAPIRDLDEAVEVALAQQPGAEIRHVRPPAELGDPAVVGMAAPGQAVPTRVWVGDEPLRPLYVFDGRAVGPATWLWHQRYAIHVGDFAGPLVRAAWIVVALLPAAFSLSGLWLYLMRGRRKRRERPGAIEREAPRPARAHSSLS
jgi:uncharacterized iron-regulated membrane protein